MALHGGGGHGQAGGHGLHHVEGQALAAAGGHRAVGGGVPGGHVPHLTGEGHPVRHAQPPGQGAALLPQGPAAGQQQADRGRQLLKGAQQVPLALALGEFGGVDQQELMVGKAQAPAEGQALAPVRPAVTVEVHPHAGNLHHLLAQPVPPGVLRIPAVHGHQQVGHRGGEPLGGGQQGPLGGGGGVVKQIAVTGAGHLGTAGQTQHRRPGEEGGQRGMTAHQGVLPRPDEPPQGRRGPGVLGGGELLLEGDGEDLLRLRNVHGRAAAGHVHPPAQAGKFRQIGPVEVDDVGICRRGE